MRLTFPGLARWSRGFAALVFVAILVADGVIQAALGQGQGGFPIRARRASTFPFDTPISGTVNPGDYTEYSFDMGQIPASKIIRVGLSSTTANLSAPILSIVRQKSTIDSFQVPISLPARSLTPSSTPSTLSGCLGRNVSRIVCPLETSPSDADAGSVPGYSGVVDVAIIGANTDNYTIEASLEDALLTIGSEVQFSASVRSARYFFLDINHNIYKPIQIVVESSDDSLAVVALKRNHCPFIGSEQDTLTYSSAFALVGSSQLTQTMTRRAALTLTKSNANLGRWFIGILVLPNDEDSCSVNKDFTLRISTYMNPLDYAYPLFVMFGIFLGIFYVTGVFLFMSKERIEKQGELFFVSELGNAVPLSSLLRAREPEPTTRASRTEPALESSVAVPLYGNASDGPSGHAAPGDMDIYADIAVAGGASTPTTANTSVNSLAAAADATDPEDADYDNMNDLLAQASKEKEFVRRKANLTVADLNRKTNKARRKRLSRYGINLIIIAVFYFLPVVQLILSYQKQYSAGNEDLCYYNFLCERPLGSFAHFNNMISNLGYVLLGGLFMLLVRIRHIRYNQQRKLADEANITLEECGIPRMYGLFYSVGIALAFEGLFSSSYHICPTSQNFQFDTAFMYVIAMLMILCLFQKRHPDLHSNPDSAYAFLASIIFINVIGVYYGNTGFWVTTFVLFVVFSVVVSVHVYYFGVWSFDRGLPMRLIASLVLFIRYTCCGLVRAWGSGARQSGHEQHTASSPGVHGRPGASLLQTRSYHLLGNSSDALPQTGDLERQDAHDEALSTHPLHATIHTEQATYIKLSPKRSTIRLAYFILANSLNFVGFLYGVIVQPNFATFLLAVLILNLLLYFSVYIVMKRQAGESMDLPTYLYMLGSAACWVPALYFFLQNVANWTLSPPESRAHNVGCIWLDFFDTHDVWHFLSAGGLFFSALVMLSMDDNLNSTPRNLIPVF